MNSKSGKRSRLVFDQDRTKLVLSVANARCSGKGVLSIPISLATLPRRAIFSFDSSRESCCQSDSIRASTGATKSRFAVVRHRLSSESAGSLSLWAHVPTIGFPAHITRLDF